MARPQHEADHEQHLVFDELDRGAFTIGAWHQDQVVGTCRVNFCGISDIGPYEDWYDAENVAGEAWPQRTALITKLMIDPDLRGTLLAHRLACETFLLGRSRGIRCALMDCNQHLLGFFATLGWCLVGQFQHPEYGTVYTHKLDLHDLNHLKQVRSPFLRLLRGSVDEERFTEVVPVTDNIIARAKVRKAAPAGSRAFGPPWTDIAAAA